MMVLTFGLLILIKRALLIRKSKQTLRFSFKNLKLLCIMREYILDGFNFV